VKYGAVSLTDVAHSDMDVLGQTFDVKIAGIRCILHPPTIAGSLSEISSKNVLPPPGGPWPSQAWWGHYTSGGPLAIKSFGITVENDTKIEEIGSVTKAIASWEQAVAAWLSVLANGPFEFIAGHTAEVVWGDTVPEVGAYFGNSQTINKPIVLTAAQWQHAFREVSAENTAPIARLLFVEGLRAMEAARFRSAVVDFATATEVALAKGLLDWLTINSSRVIAEAVLGRTKMLGSLVALAGDLSLSLPPKISRDLVEVRNRVIHGGASIGSRDASNACAIARDVVDRFQPLAASVLAARSDATE
jgi:hypothetical protein